MTRTRQEYRARITSIADLHRRERGEDMARPMSYASFRLPPRQAPHDPARRGEAQARRWSVWKKTTTVFRALPRDWLFGLALVLLLFIGVLPFAAAMLGD